MFDKGEGCFVYIIDGYGNGEMGAGGKPIYKLLEKCADMKMHHKMIAEKKKRERKANQWLQQQILAEHCRSYGNC